MEVVLIIYIRKRFRCTFCRIDNMLRSRTIVAISHKPILRATHAERSTYTHRERSTNTRRVKQPYKQIYIIKMTMQKKNQQIYIWSREQFLYGLIFYWLQSSWQMIDIIIHCCGLQNTKQTNNPTDLIICDGFFFQTQIRTQNQMCAWNTSFTSKAIMEQWGFFQSDLKLI